MPVHASSPQAGPSDSPANPELRDLQPLIIESEPLTSNTKAIVFRLGGLHIQTSYLGCVGHLMAESGLAQVLEVVYAENAVKHILSGKAIARAIRGHFIVHAALNAILAANAYKITIPINGECYDESILHQDLGKAKSLY